MFKALFQYIPVETTLPFPLYLYLKRNNRHVRFCAQGGQIDAIRHAVYKEKFTEYWIPDEFRAAYEDFIKELAKDPKNNISVEIVLGKEAAADSAKAKKSNSTSKPTAINSELSSEKNSTHESAEDYKNAQKQGKEIFSETKIVREIYNNQEMKPEEKQKRLALLSKELLGALDNVTDASEQARKKGLEKCTQITDEVLLIANMSNDLYDDILLLRNSKDSIEHSMVVSTISIMFALSLGIDNEVQLAELATAGLLHDIGLLKIPFTIISKPEQELTAEEQKLFKQHVAAGVKCLEPQDLSDNVIRMVEQHHENYDGSGYPEGLRGAEIDHLAQILHLADWFDHLSAGKITGKHVSPRDAFDQIYLENAAANKCKAIDPKLLETVFQFMHRESPTNSSNVKSFAIAKAKKVKKKVTRTGS